MNLLKRYIPKSFKIQLYRLKRKFVDILQKKKYATTIAPADIGKIQAEIQLRIMPSPFFENKVHNLKIVQQKLNGILIYSGEYFSFWKTTGKASKENGFREGRNLVAGKLSQDTGGGICQFSSLLYYAALKSGFIITERYHHSIDIYKEDERYIPLGADCTVVYGFKDLQFINPYHFPVQLKSKIEGSTISLYILAEYEIPQHEVDFEYHYEQNSVRVQTLIDQKISAESLYIKP
ncbi:VanW family protein [Elizabethkingia meningoseptica]|uniref:VanW family protein n=1 Tax=Elizabethkingia meningoseptica TaxID=238 RepID=UPI002DD62DF5|nr:VanW family protein [Elizabethkingia meningoseptica]MEC4711383.1 VanW family protein [Elizabethkingia meningoseptica]